MKKVAILMRKIFRRAVRRANQVTVEEWCEQWQGRKRRCRESTDCLYARNLNNHIVPSLGQYRLEELNEELVKGFIQELAQKGLHTNTIVGIVRLLYTVLGAAVKDGLMDPLPEVSVPAGEDEEFEEARCLNRRERRSIVFEAQRRKYFEIIVALYTGMRLGEITGLIWKNVDLKEGFIIIKQSIGRLPNDSKKSRRKTALKSQKPKSRAAVRRIPLPDRIKLLMQYMWQESRQNPYDFVFGAEKHPERCADPTTFQKRLKRVCKALGIEDVHFHTLRHTFATACAEKNFDPESLRKLLGHSSAKTTARYYLHSLEEHRVELMRERFQLYDEPEELKRAVAGLRI